MTSKHIFSIEVPVSQAYEAASSLGGLRSWWTSDISGSPEQGNELRLGFGTGRSWTMQVKELKLNKWIIWTITSTTLAPATRWKRTELSLRFLKDDDRTTKVVLEYEDRPDIQKHFLEHWVRSMESYVQLCETGKGTPENPKRDIPSRPHRTNYPS